MRAVIVAAGDLDNLPAEIQSVANTLSAADWTVHLCLGADASHAGLLAAAGAGPANLVWFGLHSGAQGFALSDGVWPAAQLGVWLNNIGATDCVLNSCYSIEHVEAIQRAADVNIAAAIDPSGVDDVLAWQVGVYLVRSYVISGDLQAAVRNATGYGSVQYRYVPSGDARDAGGRRPMPIDTEIKDQLKEILRALYGEEKNAYAGLGRRVADVQQSVTTMADEQRHWQNEQRLWRSDIERRVANLEAGRVMAVTSRSVSIIVAMVTVIVCVLFVLFLRLGGWL